MVPILDDQGTVVHPALDQKTAMEYSASAFREAAGDPNRKDQFKGFLTGEIQDMPEGWVETNDTVPSPASARRSAMADSAARGRKEHPVQAALYDYGVDPLARAAGAVIDVPVNIGIGAANLIPGVDISPISTRKAAATLFQFIGNEDKTTWAEASQQTGEQMQAMDDTKGFVAKSAAFAGDLSGVLKGLQGKIAQGVFAPGAKLGEGAVKLGAKAFGKEASTRALGYGAAAGSFAGYDALTARGADGGKASLADRGEAAMYGALAGTIIQGSSELGRAAFKGILKRGMGDLGPAEKKSLEGLKKWALDNKVAPVPRESQQAYMNRLVDTWVNAGAPGMVSSARQLAGYVTQGTIKGIGFMGLDAMDAHFRSELSDAVFKGDQDAILNIMAKVVANSFVMTAHEMPLREIAGYQRRQPTRVEPTYQQGPSGKGPEITPDHLRNVQEQQADAASNKAQADLQAKVAADKRSVEDQAAYDEASKTARPIGSDYSTSKGPNPARDPATGTYLSQDLERLGWEPQEPAKSTITGFDPSMTEADKKQHEVASEEAPNAFRIPGTSFSFEVKGDVATPSPELRQTLGLPESMPAEKMQESLDTASLISSMQAKVMLPGEEISADGMKAEVKGEEAVVRAIRLGEVVEAHLSPEMDWKPAESFPARGKDPIDNVQSAAVDALTEVLNTRSDMRGRDRALLSSVIDVLDAVAAQRDPAVADMVHHLPDALQGLHSASPEHAGKIVKALAEMLTTKSPEVALDDLVRTMQESQEPKPNPEAGFLNVGAGMEDVGKVLSGAFDGGRIVGKSIYDTTIRDQMTSLSKRSGDRSMEDSMREANTIGATNHAQAMERFKPAEEPLRKNLKRYLEEVQTDTGKKPRWIALGEERIAPESEADAVVAKAVKETLLELHRQGRESGGLIRVTNEEGKNEIQPISEVDKAKVPYVRGEDYGKVMGNNELRKQWFDHLAEQNPKMISVVDPVTKRTVRRTRTGADLEAEHEAERTTSTHKGTERTAAYEHFRRFPVMDAVWNGNKMLEVNPFETMHSIIRQQSGRAAVEKVFGPDLAAEVPEADRARLGITEDKLGSEKRIVDWSGKTNIRDEDKRELVQDASNTIIRLQGGEPINVKQWARTYRRGASYLRAVKVMKAGIMDIGSMVFDPATFTARFLLGAKALGKVITGYKDARQEAEVAGALMHHVGNYELKEATDPLDRLLDVLSWAGNKTEKLKTVIFDKTAKLLLDNWSRGIVNSNDRQMVEKILDFTPEQTQKLLSGTAGKTLRDQFNQEFVFHTASRGRSVNRSRAASNPYFNAIVAFGNWATKRVFGLAKEAKSMSILWEKNSTTRERMGAMKFAASRATGIVLGGMASQALVYVWQDMFKGKNGLKRWWKDLMSSPKSMVGSATVGSMLGGPLGTIWNAANSKPESVLNVVEPLNIVYQGLKAYQDEKTPTAMYDFFTAIGAVPLGREVKTTLTYLGAARVGTTQHISDESDVYSFMRLKGIESPKFQAQPRTAEFQAALRSIQNDLYRQDATGEDAGRITYKAMEEKLTTALGLETGKSLASAIRNFRSLDVLQDAQTRIEFHDHIGSEQYKRMRLHDNMIEDLAKLVSKQHGTETTAFESELDVAAKSAAHGDGNVWNSIATRSVDDAAAMMKLNEPVGDDIKTLAARMASHPESLERDGTFSGRELERLLRADMKYSDRAHLIEVALVKRAHAKVARDRKAEQEELRRLSTK